MFGIGRYGFAMGHGYGWLSWVAPIAMIVFWALFVAAVVMLIVYLARRGRISTHANSALTILRERYARGEISKQEFEEKQKDLA
jgi:putative membrane protein